MPDFHFARRDAVGAWSQKVGEAPATDRDSAGRPITDPEVSGRSRKQEERQLAQNCCGSCSC